MDMDYIKIYTQIIDRAQNRNLDGYFELHHITPKCIGGKDISENLVKLTAREHYICHKLLCKIYPQEDKLLYSLWLMAIGKNRQSKLDPYKISGREYEDLKLKFIERRKLVKVSPKHKSVIAKSNSRPIYQYDLLGNFLKKWDSAMEAQRSFSKNTHWKDLGSSISAAARGEHKTSFGYIWYYDLVEVDLEKHKISRGKSKSIVSLDFEGNIIKEYTSKSQAKVDLKFTEHSFRKLIKGEKVKGKKGNEYNYILKWKHKQ
jgi:hypothetical protein